MGKKMLETKVKMELSEAVKCMSIVGDSYQMKNGNIKFEYLAEGMLTVKVSEEAFENYKTQRLIGVLVIHGAVWIPVEESPE